jgi:hypothetical protein
MPYDSRTPENASSTFNAGPYLARIVNNIDPKYMGTLQVQLLRDVGNIPESEGSLFQVKYLTPFYGVTSLDHVGKNNTYGDTQKSYGMWMVPPDVGVLVLVIFVEGDPKQGYWMGCVQDEFMNFMVPGVAATSLKVPFNADKAPVAEYNKKINTNEQSDTTLIKKPEHPFANTLTTQGLLNDETRGITTSSARRESPSNVFGISTPGPIDRSSSGARGNIGPKESRITGAFVSRLGGSTFVMDDGDDNFLRKASAETDKPEYVSVENEERGGDVKIPHNELVRIRTRTGHQILLHNSEDLIYIGNAKGTTWIELTSNGKIDIYAKDSVSVYSENDINFTAKRDINLTAETGNVNINASVNFNATAGANYEIKAGADGKLTVGGSSNIKAGGNHVETAAAIHMNGPAAATAQSAPKANRIPKHEPWPGHENLNPKNFTADKTRAKATPDVPAETLTKILDTFKKIGK